MNWGKRNSYAQTSSTRPVKNQNRCCVFRFPHGRRNQLVRANFWENTLPVWKDKPSSRINPMFYGRSRLISTAIVWHSICPLGYQVTP